MPQRFFQFYFYSIAIIVLLFGYSIYLVNFSPEAQSLVQAKDNAQFLLFLMPSVALLVTVIIATASQMPEIFPNQEGQETTENLNSDHQMHAISRMNLAVIFFFMWMHFAIVNDLKNPSEFILMSQVSFAMGILMIGIGITTKEIQRNLAIGFRTPWSIQNAKNWQKTHHFASRVFVFFGVINLLINFLLQHFQINEIFFVSLPAVLIIVASLIVYFYSYFIYREKLDQ